MAPASKRQAPQARLASAYCQSDVRVVNLPKARVGRLH